MARKAAASGAGIPGGNPGKPGPSNGPLAARNLIASMFCSAWDTDGAEDELSVFTGVGGCEPARIWKMNKLETSNGPALG